MMKTDRRPVDHPLWPSFVKWYEAYRGKGPRLPSRWRPFWQCFLAGSQRGFHSRPCWENSMKAIEAGARRRSEETI